MALNMKIVVLWDVTLSRFVARYSKQYIVLGGMRVCVLKKTLKVNQKKLSL
jgi:hypothetical protein